MTLSEQPRSLLRFDAVERAVHWLNALLFLTLLGTGAALYGLPLTGWIGNRDVVKDIHVWSGLALPFPIVLGVLSSAALRGDIRRFSRWTVDDRRWWSKRLRPRVTLGKFNPGQKANAAFVGAAIVVMLATGALMRWPGPFTDDWRTGASFVHDSFFFALSAVIIGHIALALSDGVALRAMVTGRVPAAWALRHAPGWAEPTDGSIDS